MKHISIPDLYQGIFKIVVCSDSFKLQTTRAIKFVCVTYESNKFIVIKMKDLLNSFCSLASLGMGFLNENI